MKKINSKSFTELREYLDQVPVIETHEHYVFGTKPVPVTNVLDFVVGSYYISDLQSVSSDTEYTVADAIKNDALPFDERYAVFEKVYKKSNKTAYAKSTLTGLKECWGVNDLSKESILALQEKLKDRDEAFYNRMMEKYKIRAKVLNVYADDTFTDIVEGKNSSFSEYCRFAFPLMSYHTVNNTFTITRLSKYIGHKITSLDEYVEAFDIYFKQCIDFGIVCVKDQSAYLRKLDYKTRSKAEAEMVFNKIMYNAREGVASENAIILNDWLFHHFMRLAQKYKLPVQLHTGHMAGIRNEITKTNAVHLIPLMELYSDVKFDLFHANWPYMDEFLFIGKNFPNVYLDLCWAQSIDPLYCIELMKRAIMTVPHSKILAFGGDTDYIEQTVGFLCLARDNVAYALSDMVDGGWLDMTEAKGIACDWFFNNPNELFNLGYERIDKI